MCGPYFTVIDTRTKNDIKKYLLTQSISEIIFSRKSKVVFFRILDIHFAHFILVFSAFTSTVITQGFLLTLAVVHGHQCFLFVQLMDTHARALVAARETHSESFVPHQ